MQRFIQAVLLATGLLCVGLVQAEPYLAFKTGNKCVACHVNPIGGGMRSTYGAAYGATLLPESTYTGAGNFDVGQITPAIRFGGDLRFNFDAESPDDGEDSRGFQVQSGQIYVAITPESLPVSFYLDEQIAPGGALNREAYGMLKFGDDKRHYVRAGKIMLPYGIRLEDDDAFIRQASQVTFDNSDNGVEMGLEFNDAVINLLASNGTSALSNDDNAFQYGVRGEYVREHWRIGSSAIYNDAEAGARLMVNLFAGFTYGPLTVLGEVDLIRDDSKENIPGEPEKAIATFLEGNFEVAQGHNVKLTTEFFDPDDNIDENEQTRHSAVYEYTPYAHIQLRAGVRFNEDIPQIPNQNTDQAFGQVHFYF